MPIIWGCSEILPNIAYVREQETKHFTGRPYSKCLNIHVWKTSNRDKVQLYLGIDVLSDTTNDLSLTVKPQCKIFIPFQAVI